MATYPYFVLGPTAILSTIGLLHGPDETIPTPKDDWREAIVDVIIPAYNEQHNITLCLASLTKQTLKPRTITLIDDNSVDDTSHYAAEFSKKVGLDLKIIKRKMSEGKTPSLSHGAQESDADVEFVLDGDTVLESENYIERLVQELYQGVGIASACGVVLPLKEKDYRDMLEQMPSLESFQEQNPDTKFFLPVNWYQRLGQGIVHAYRDILYKFLQRFIYHGEMVFFGSIINPVGCAVAYRRKYVKAILDAHADTLEFDLTTSEDIFIGFNFIFEGYRNIQLQDVIARTKEPPLKRLPHQVFLWSSAFLQSCYYFDALLKSPFRSLKLWYKNRKEKKSSAHKEILERRKIKEAYRQSFGAAYTEKFGRPMGWYIFTSAFEKISFPLILLLLIVFQAWKIVLITFIAELMLSSFVVLAISSRGERIRSFGKSILIAPVRYFFLFFDLYVIGVFFTDVALKKDKKWRK